MVQEQTIRAICYLEFKADILDTRSELMITVYYFHYSCFRLSNPLCAPFKWKLAAPPAQPATPAPQERPQ